MDTVIQKSYYLFLKDFVEKHLDLLTNRRVYIFGAGPRGCNLLQLLRMFQISDLYFVDNNPKKQGKRLDGCIILSFPEADSYRGSCCFLCPVEGGQQILEQLKEAGYRKNVDYFNLDTQFTDYLNLIEEFKNPPNDNRYSIAFGCCILAASILGSKFVPSLGERLRDQLFGREACKMFALPGLSAPMYYHITDAALQLYGKKPNFIFALVETTLFSRHHPLFMGKMVYSQHKLFLEQLIDAVPPSDTLLAYYHCIAGRLKNCSAANNPSKSFNIEKALQTVYRLEYNFDPDDINENNECVVYLRKLLELARDKNIPVILFFPPVDYLTGERVLGPDFTPRYEFILQKIKSMLKGYPFSCIDASFIAASDHFVQYSHYNPDINPILNEKGQNLILELLSQQKTVQDLLRPE